ncbi:velvet factor-domain-containing protein [Annulohypoxylon maeteangense]|uniref:velvet factor-domain-containing protein n=1 Tax=Annulohypoxylon maeteangense TaxID=1927788 RepID=UPI00200875AB|nr:velvet factor-domain-containing protein [Annulohypoxylon maeteangense]KAI0887524.1 velvet factor-domain-containing protein [Annulohypoxylon maeteangense]
MVDTMARPPESWAQDPYAPRHASYYAQEQSQEVRLPPLPNLVTGPRTTQGPPARQHPPTYSHNSYEGSYASSSSPVYPNPQHSIPGPESHAAVSSPYARQSIDAGSRLPARPPSVSERAGEPPEYNRFRQLGGEANSMPAPRLPLQQQPRQIGGSPQQQHQQHHYADIQPVRPTTEYRYQETRPQPSPQAIAPPRPAWQPQPEIRAPERVKISDLIHAPKTGESGSSKAPERRRVPAAASSTYKLKVRQQPVAARSCGFGERDRRVIDPPPIVQVFIEDPKASQDEIRTQLKFRFSVMHCTIWNETGDQDCSGMPDDFRQQRRLMGTIVSSPFVGIDEKNEEGCFFCFPDLSCRTPGTFRLRFSLVVLDPNSVPGSKTPVCAIAMSEVFTVYNAKDFPGMRASTALTKRLKEQGCLISIKKGNERNHAREDSEDDDEDEDEGSSSVPRRAKRSRKT